VKALTLKHPWPWAILELGKDIENRTWFPPRDEVGEWLAIHGGVVPRSGRAYLEVLHDLAELEARGLAPRGTPLSSVWRPGIVALARLEDTVSESSSRWFHGPVGWVLADVVKLPEPIRIPGAQGLWPVPDPVVRILRRQFRAVRAGSSC
jgi:hypothetical protein